MMSNKQTDDWDLPSATFIRPPGKSFDLWRKVGIPVVSILVALFIRVALLSGILGDRGPLVTFLLAVVVSVIYGGFFGGLLATFLTLVVTVYYLIPPTGSMLVTDVTTVTLLGSFAINGVVLSVLGELLIRSWNRERLRLEEITAEKEKLRVSLESIAEAVFAVDAEGRLSFMNVAAEALTGWDEAEAKGRRFDEVIRLVDPETRTPFPSSLERPLRSGGNVHPTHYPHLIARDGTERPIDESVSPILDPGRHIVGAMLVCRDMTERKRAESTIRASEERLRLATSAADVGIWDYDASSGSIECDERARRHLGLPPDVPIRISDLIETIYPPDRDHVNRVIGEVLANRANELDLEYRIKTAEDPSERWLEARGRRVKGAKADSIRLTGTIQDITTHKRAEETLREADRLKNDFLAILAHELRNPLAPILSGLEILKQTDQEQDRVRARDMMERQVGYMVHLINDLLDISRVTRGKIQLKLELVDFKEILDRALEASRPALEMGGHQIEVEIADEPLPVVADRTRLVQVFGNLLNNAAKYTPDGGHIQVRVVREGSSVRATVRDDGVGIKPEMLANVFELFAQSDRLINRAKGGLGIGLTLVRSLVELHHGKVEAESEGLGKGSTFTVQLPLDRFAPNKSSTTVGGCAAPSPTRRVTSRPSLKILVVDDNHDAAESLTMILKLQGHQTRTVNSGQEALEANDEYHPDLVLLDIGLPGIDGHEVARRIRARHENKQPVLIALTGWGSEQDRKQSKDAGFDYHVTKPVETQTLVEILHKVHEGLIGVVVGG